MLAIALLRLIPRAGAMAAKRVAKVLPPTPDGVARAGKVLASGGLCAFPTETVYGLGASALEERAVRRVFEVKERPLSDPLIVHVAKPEDALALIELDGACRKAFDALTKAFWPGPLTLVCPARAHLPDCLSAGTATVGVRCPSHALARQLIEAAGVPIAAPSANKFGHVSPTTAAHVLDDLGSEDISILDGGASGAAQCEHGIESTVVGLRTEGATCVLTLYRRGALPRASLEDICTQVGARLSTADTYASEAKPDASGAPGQLLTHYAPRLPAALVTVVADAAADDAKSDAHLATCVIVDFAGRLKGLEATARAYRDLSVAGDAKVAANALFDTLRWAEGVPGAANVFIADLSAERDSSALIAGVADRVYRAASGNAIKIPRAK